MTNRMEKINELIKRELSLLVQDEFASKYGMIVVQDVQSSKDIKNAKIFISVFDNTNVEKILSDIHKKTYYFQGVLAKKLSTKNIPKLEFVIDDTQEKIDRVEKIISFIEKENN